MLIRVWRTARKSRFKSANTVSWRVKRGPWHRKPNSAIASHPRLEKTFKFSLRLGSRRRGRVFTNSREGRRGNESERANRENCERRGKMGKGYFLVLASA